jgi:hypothetical protein
MKRSVVLVVVALAAIGSHGFAEEPVGTAFTYQGLLKDDGVPVTGTANFIFSLWDAPTGGNDIAYFESPSDYPVVDGLFSIELDFNIPDGWIYDGTALWLQVAVDYPAGSGNWETLMPRQRLTTAPFASFSYLSTAVPWDGILDMPPGFADGVDDVGNGAFWSLTGNAGTVPGTHRLGTLDDVPLEVCVNGMRALRLEPGSTPNVIGGHPNNAVDSNVAGATIAGGVNNFVAGNYAAVGGGGNNQANGSHSAVAGGSYNSVTGDGAFVGAGYSNGAAGANSAVVCGSNNEATGGHSYVVGGSGNQATAAHTFVGAGYQNTAVRTYGAVVGGLGNSAGGAFAGDYAAVAGGYGNQVRGDHGSIGGGMSNTIHNYVERATIGGGESNEIGGHAGTIGGGALNVIRDGAENATIAGGAPSDPNDPANTNNRVYDAYGTVGGGGHNWAGNDDGDPTSAVFATVAGGWRNYATGIQSGVMSGGNNRANGANSCVGGGYANNISGHYAVISGGGGNVAGQNYSAVGGGLANYSNAAHGTIAGGESNSAHSTGAWAAIGGGKSNEVTQEYGTVPGGQENLAGGEYSFAAGRRAKVRRPDDVGGGDTNGDEGTFVWADSTGDAFWSTAPNQFLIRASGGVGIGTNAPASNAALHVDAGTYYGIKASGTSYGISGTTSTGSGGAGMRAEATGGGGSDGIQATSNGRSAVRATGTSTAYGVWAQASGTDGTAVHGEATGSNLTYGGYFSSAGDIGTGVYGTASGSTGRGVIGETTGAYAIGVYGLGDTGVKGECTNEGGTAIEAVVTSNYGDALYAAAGATGGYAAQFVGDVDITGNFTCSGNKQFRIDHPLDPQNKYLYHSCVESPDMMNVYNGNVVTDESGYAVVVLPDWFEALNREFRYQLTVLDDTDDDAFVLAKVVRKVTANQFTIRTSAPHTEVSWQITGIRHDPWAEAHRTIVEVDKSAPVRR